MTRNGMRAALSPSHEVNGCLRLASIPGRPSVNGEALSELSSEIFGIGTTNVRYGHSVWQPHHKNTVQGR